MDRRRFLVISSFATAGALLAPGSAGDGTRVDTERFREANVERAKQRLNVLFLGGTDFVGPPTVQHALDRGHQVTLFNRGITNLYLFPQVPRLRGDRSPNVAAGLSALEGRKWDVVIDTWQGSPLPVRRSAELLRPNTRQYIYISSIAVYGERNYTQQAEITEDTSLPPVPALPLEPAIKIDYPTRKLLSEIAAQEVLGEKLTIIRPHSICGYYMEGSDNQLYWPVRVNRGGDILAPGDGLDTTQYIDVRDLAQWIVHVAESSLLGTYNACRQQSFLEYLYGLKALTSATSHFHWVPVEFLDKPGVRDFDNMPMWVPRSKAPGFFNISARKAATAGIRFRPMADTFKEVLAGFFASRPADYEFGTDGRTEGLPRERERELLKLWRAGR